MQVAIIFLLVVLVASQLEAAPAPKGKTSPHTKASPPTTKAFSPSTTKPRPFTGKGLLKSMSVLNEVEIKNVIIIRSRTFFE